MLVAACAAQETAPESRAASRPVTELVLDDGLRVRLVPVDLPGEIAVILAIRGAGILSEPTGVPHLAHVSEHALFYAQPPASIEGKLVETLFESARANAETLPDLMYFDIQPDPADLRAALRAQGWRLSKAFVEPVTLDREKSRALGEVWGLERSRTAKTDFLGKFAWSAFVQIAVHGARQVRFAEITPSISAEAIVAFHRRTFRANRSMVTIVGDFDPPRRISELMAPLARSSAGASGDSRPSLRKGSLAGTWDVASHQFFMAWPAPAPADSSHPELSVAAQILRTKLGQSADVRKLSRQPIGVHADVGGLFAIQIPLRAPDAGDALAAEIRKVIDSLATDATELRGLKAHKAGVRTGAGLTAGPVRYPPNVPRKILVHANLELARMRATLAWDQTPEDYCDRVDRVIEDEIRAAIRTWLAPEKATIVTIAGKE